MHTYQEFSRIFSKGGGGERIDRKACCRFYKCMKPKARSSMSPDLLWKLVNTVH